MLIWGTLCCGKTDRVPGLFHVTTRFWHFWFIPLIPVGTVLVLEDQGEGRGIEIPFSGKSLLLGWLRGATLIAGIVLTLIGLQAGRDRGVLVAGLAALTVSIVLTFVPAFTSARFERAVEIGRSIGLPPAGMALIERQYGVRSEIEAPVASDAICAGCGDVFQPQQNPWDAAGFCSPACRDFSGIGGR